MDLLRRCAGAWRARVPVMRRLHLAGLLLVAAGLPAQAVPHGPQAPELFDLQPGTLVVREGQSGLLQVTLAAWSGRPGVLHVDSSPPQVVEVPAQVRFTKADRRISIPVKALRTGTASLTVRLAHQSLVSRVSVLPMPPRVIGIEPARATLREGAGSEFRVRIAPRPPAETLVVELRSSDPARLAVPAAVEVLPGQDTATFTAQALRAGPVQVVAQMRTAAASSQATAQVQVVPLPPVVAGLLPGTLTLQPEAGARLTVRLSAAQAADTVVTLSSEPSGVIEGPASVVVPAGQSEAAFEVRGRATGNVAVQAALGESRVLARVQVMPVPVTVASLEPAASSLAVGTEAALRVGLSAAPAQETRLHLSATPAGIVQVPAQVVFAPGQSTAIVPVTALSAGEAEVTAERPGPDGPSQRRTHLTVGPPRPVSLASLTPALGQVQQGAAAFLLLRLSAAQPQPVAVALSVQDPAVVRVPASVTVPAGQLELRVPVLALAPEASRVMASVPGSDLSATVRVVPSPPQVAALQPSVQELPRGRLGRLRLQLDRAPRADTVVAIGNAQPSVLEAPAQVTVPAGESEVEVPVLARQEGRAELSASLEGALVRASVQVVPPELVSLAVRPQEPSLAPGQRLPLQAIGTYSDAGTRDVTGEAATTWRAAPASVAQVDPGGQVTGLQAGQATVSASQAVSPTWSQPQPDPVVGQARATVGPAAPLAMATGRTRLTVGETATVSITTPYPAGAAAYPIQLDASGSGTLQFSAAASVGPGLTSVSIPVRAMAAGTVTLQARGAPFAPAQLAFTIEPAAPTGPAIRSVVPDRAAPGARVTLEGNAFASPASANAVAFAGNVPATVLSGSGEQLVVEVPGAAQSGPITVTHALGTASSPVFTVLREQDFELQASPSQLQLVQGANAQVALALASQGTRAYEGLARLSVTGLPAGVTARFEPPMLSAFQSGRLVLEAGRGAAVGAATVTVRAEATLDGVPWSREGRVQVQTVAGAGLTGVKGRFVTPEGVGVAGVIVRQDTTTQQVVSDAAGNFLITGLPAGVTTLRFDATPAHALYPIWPYNVTLAAGELLTVSDWVLHPPPPNERFKPIDNATRDQAITDERYPGFAVVLPAGVSITGWDGVKKTRIAVERLTPDRLPVGAPPFPMKEAYQLYFGTPMGGIPSAPIPVQLPNVAEREPGEKVDIWWFDGSPMGGTGEWKKAGTGTVSEDGRTVRSDPGVGLPRFCGVCGLVSLSCPPPPQPPQPPPTCPTPSAGNPVDLFTGQELASVGGLSCGGVSPVETSLAFNPVDAFNNRAGTVASFGLGWTFGHDVSFLPFDGPQKRLVLPGGRLVNLVDDGSGTYRPADNPLLTGTFARSLGSGTWEVVRPDGTRWQFEPFPGISGLIRGGPPLFLTKQTDANGNITQVARQNNGRIQSITAPEKRGITFTYGSNGFVREMADHTGRRQRFDYTASHRIQRVTDALGRETVFSYWQPPVYRNTYAGCSAVDASGNCTRWFSQTITACEGELPQGFEGIASIRYPTSSTPTVNTYGTDRIVRQVTSQGQDWRFSYRRVGACVARIIEPPRSSGGTTESFLSTCRAGQPLPGGGTCPEVESAQTLEAGWRFFGGVNVETRVTTPDGQQRVYRFNARGMPTEVTDESGQTTRHFYDARQQRVKSIDPLGRETQTDHDDLGRAVRIVDPLGRSLQRSYDASSTRLAGSTRFLLGVPSVQAGQQVSYTPVRDSLAYDAKGNLASWTDATGLVTRWAFDSRGLLQRLTLPVRADAAQVPVMVAGAPSTMPATARLLTSTYTPEGDLATLTDALGHETRIVSDALGRVATVTDPLGYTSRQQYDAADHPTLSSDALGQDTRLVYDAAGRLTGVVNQAGVTIEAYAYDANGRLERSTDALGLVTRFEYDAAGRTVAVTDPKGQVTRLAYDARGALAQVEKADRTMVFQHDAAGRLAQVRDGGTVTSWRYDAADRVVQVDTTTAAGSHRLGYAYDSLDRVTRRTLSGTGIAQPETTDYAWDLAGRLLSHTTTLGGQSHTTRYKYDVAGRLAARKVQAGEQLDAVTQRYGWDATDRLAQIRYLRNEGTAGEQLIEQIDYGYDANGRRTVRASVKNYGVGLSDTPMEATYDAGNRMTAVTLEIGGAKKSYSLGHDANGNLVAKQNTADAADKTTYRWDADNRLVGLSQPGVESSFSYDAFGRRIQASITRAGQPTSTVQYLYEGQQSLGEIRDGRLSHRLLTGLRLDEGIARLALDSNGKPSAEGGRVLLTDALNSVIAELRAEAGAGLGNTYAYSPYGETAVRGNHDAGNPVQYTGRENDGTGVYYYRARYYDPVIGRFVQSDPIGLAGGINTYEYVGGSPTSRTDPMGLRCNGSGCWTTPAESALAMTGNYAAYYQAACAGGDSYACFAGHVAANDNFAGALANGRLEGALDKLEMQKSVCLSREKVMNDIRQQLAKAYANMLPQSQSAAAFPTADGVAAFHWQVFGEYGLPPSTFGGTPFGTTPVLPGYWCPNCK
ncbi:RHS repeat-associated core domain-containing protein [Ramlibacter sp. MAHUQ-53]|uniref:RHS repeat-associated core domain-containing protein n=1 Tax=unclassified Ramlibacter TaxID=2617605 RepID=UPI0036278751